MKTDDIITYVRLKFGYPLTVESYINFPIDLVEEIYYSLIPLPYSADLIRGQIQYDILLHKNHVEYWTKSNIVYKIIYNYYAENN